MKIIFCGGGSGGHFYPLIAVAEALRDITRKNKLIQPQLFYLSPDPYDQAMLFDNEIEFQKISSGKIRRYFSLKNIFDIFKTFFGFIIWVVVFTGWRISYMFIDWTQEYKKMKNENRTV